MDPISHAIAGRFLVVAGTRAREGRGVAVAAVLGALSPDMDAVFMPVGWDIYLRVHQAGLHTLTGTAACAVLVATVVSVFARGGRWGALLLAAWVGALSHVALDILSGATVRLLWPFSEAITRYGLVAMAEPSIAAMLVVAAIVSWRWPARRMNAAATALAFVAVVLVGKAALRVEAQRLYETATRGNAVRGAILEAEWGTFSRWVVIDRTGDRVRRWRVDTSRSTATRALDVPVATETGRVAASLPAAVVQNFLASHEFPVAVTTGDAASADVRWSDARYCWAPSAPGAVRALVGSSVRPAGLPIACGLWFGVTLDAQDAITRQFVTIGEWTQQR